MRNNWDVVVIGSGNAALCAGIAAQAAGHDVLIIEKANVALAGGNSKYTAGAMRFAYDTHEDLLPLLLDPDDERLAHTDFGQYTRASFERDLLNFNGGRPISAEQRLLLDQSYDVVRWLASHDVRFEPIYSRQSFEKGGRHVFWGGLTLEAHNEGVGLVEAELRAFKALGGEIVYETTAIDLLQDNGVVVGVRCEDADGERRDLHAGAVVLGCGGFEANTELRARFLGPAWASAKVRGTPHNIGQGLEMAWRIGAMPYGLYDGCHATPMDLYTPPYGNLHIPATDRKNYRKICYFLGVMVNANGERFLDEGLDFRNYTYAQFGRAVLEQPGHFAWQIFDSKVDDLLYEEYHFYDAHFVTSQTLDGLLAQLDGVEDKQALRATIDAFNGAVDESAMFDPTIKDGRRTRGLAIDKSNWAQKLDSAPFKAYPVTGGITFTYGGLKVGSNGEVLREDGSAIQRLYACGEMVGGVFFDGYPGGTGLTSGAVFGRLAGLGAARAVADARAVLVAK